MRPFHLTKAASGLLVVAAFFGAGGCGTDEVARTINAYIPASCAGASPSNAYATYTVLGDFEDVPTDTDQYHFSDVGTALTSFRGDAKEVLISAALVAAPGAWFGEAPVPAGGDIDVLLWQRTSSCTLTTPGDGRAGASLGVTGGGNLLVVGGTGSGSAKSYVTSLTTGATTTLLQDLTTPRSGATVTAVAAGAVVAGGVDPENNASSSAEVFADQGTGTGGFAGSPIALSTARMEHGAVELVDGRVLLVGGRTGPSAQVLATMEIVDPATGRNVAQGIAPLAVPRARPAVLRMATGKVLVGGGVDDANLPVGTVEWFEYDPRTVEVSFAGRLDLGPTAGGETWAFAPLPAGGALAVVGRSCDARHPNAWVLRDDAQGAGVCATDDCPGGAPLGAVRLFAGPDGEPALWTGEDWLRWQPWQGSFQCVDSGGIPGPAPGDVDGTPEPGLALWLDAVGDGSKLSGFRFDARSAFAPLGTEPLFTQTTLHTAPDRLVVPSISGDVVFETGVGLTLAACAGGLCPSAFVTDSTFADLTLDVDVIAGVAAPLVVLRADDGSEFAVGSGDCSYGSTPPAHTIHVTRSGQTVAISVDGGPLATCPSIVNPAARLSVGLRSSQEDIPSGALSLRIQRQ